MFHQDLTPEFWVNLAAMIFFAATVGLMLLDIRTQRKGLRQAAYQAVRVDHTELVRMILNTPLLNQVYENIQKPDKREWKDFTNDEKTIGHYYGLHNDLYERLFALYEEKIITPKEWEQWMQWLKEMSGHWLFEYVFRDVEDVLDEGFVDAVNQEILGTPKAQPI